MTHGDKAKAKDGKSSQASGEKRSSAKNGEGVVQAAGKTDAAGKGSKAAAKGSPKAGAGKADSGGKKQQAASVAEKSSSSAKSGGSSGDKGSSSAEKASGDANSGSAKGAAGKSGSSASAEIRAKARGPADSNGTFSNPVVGAAYKHALKKYNNAFRRLTD
jgi:hypothetical protein